MDAETYNLAKLKETADQNGITVTDEQTAKVRAASEAAATYKDKLQDLEQAQAQAAETARYFGNALSSGFADAILEGMRRSVLDAIGSDIAGASRHQSRLAWAKASWSRPASRGTLPCPTASMTPVPASG